MDDCKMMSSDKLPHDFLEVSRSAWTCPGLEASRQQMSPCRDVLSAFKVLPESPVRRGLGWGNPLARVWFIGINPQIAEDRPTDWGINSSRDWEKADALSGYGEGQPAFNARHFNYHRDIMRMAAESLLWPDEPLQQRAFFTDIVLCGSPKADLRRDMVEQCAQRHLFPIVEAMIPRTLVCVGLKPLRQLWRLLGGDESAVSGRMRDIGGTRLMVRHAGHDLVVVPAPQPWQRWKSGEKEVVMQRVADAIAASLA